MFDRPLDPFELVDDFDYTVSRVIPSDVVRGAAERGFAAPAARDLDKKGQYVVPGFRESRHERRRAVKWAWGRVLENTPIARCGAVSSKSFTVGSVSVVPLVKRYGVVSPVGVVTCHNKHTCPDCSIKADRATRETLSAVNADHQASGGVVAMLTLTIGHKYGDALREILDRLLERATALLSPGGKQNKRRREIFGFLGGYKALECTIGKNGFHPHLHVPIFFEPGTRDEQITEFANELKDAWVDMCAGDVSPATRQNQNLVFDDTPIGGPGERIAQYVAKSGLAWEATSRSTKGGRNGSRSIFEVAEDYAEFQRPLDAAIMREFNDAMKGRKRITPFGEIRKMYAGRVKTEWEDEFHGEENAASEPEEICAIEAEIFNEVCAMGHRELLLDAAESGGLVGVKALLHNLGFHRNQGVWPPGLAEPVRRKRKTLRNSEKENDDD